MNIETLSKAVKFQNSNQISILIFISYFNFKIVVLAKKPEISNKVLSKNKTEDPVDIVNSQVFFSPDYLLFILH